MFSKGVTSRFRWREGGLPTHIIFKAVADYIHLNPARAGLAGGAAGKLVAYPWSSLRHYAKGGPPDWLVLTRVLDAFKLSHDLRGRSAYVTWLEKRAASDGGGIDEEAMTALRSGWYLGEVRFKDKLLGLMDQVKSKVRKKDSHAGGLSGRTTRARRRGSSRRWPRVSACRSCVRS